MPVTTFAAPLLPGTTDTWIQAATEMNGPRTTSCGMTDQPSGRLYSAGSGGIGGTWSKLLTSNPHVSTGLPH